MTGFSQIKAFILSIPLTAFNGYLRYMHMHMLIKFFGWPLYL